MTTAELRNLLAEASPLPWEVSSLCAAGVDHWFIEPACDRTQAICTLSTCCAVPPAANAALIAAAINNLPALLELVEAARAIADCIHWHLHMGHYVLRPNCGSLAEELVNRFQAAVRQLSPTAAEEATNGN